MSLPVKREGHMSFFYCIEGGAIRKKRGFFNRYRVMFRINLVKMTGMTVGQA